MSKLIERDAAVEVLNQLVRERFSLSDGFQFYIDALKDVELNVMALPTVDAVPVTTGTWKAVTDDGENYKRICTCCGKEAPFDELEGVYMIYPHCPWCGARMDGEDGEQA